MRALVTGGAGFLGSYLCERLLEEDAQVICMDSFLTGGPRNVEHLMDRPEFRLIECDLTGYVHVPDRLDLVLHFASAASPADYLRYPIETLRVGSAGTLHALGLAREKGARFVLASTSEVYGDPLEHPQRETYWGNVNPVGPRSVYDEAKRFAESLTTAYRHSRGTDTGIVRIFNTYGPRMRPFDGRAIPTFIRQALKGEPITITGDGSQTRSVCYVDDTVSGILAMARSHFGGPVNIGNPDELTMLELATMIKDLAGSSSEIVFIDRPADDPKVRRPDTSLAAEQLGWRARVPAAEGLRRTIEWFTAELASMDQLEQLQV
ncbi:UDP-glucuronic acid decarboxylase family protein [Nonomuraea diastatica]|uniref:SDR family oxidoreductase n=1 Tax=Nonomuraea diastatica TaxID=1848329 RepID=A0A4R4W5U7_9ACTN|nr:UDP-glucuronic acid decarboxylase family protein [Nonomuraea diastatica]TDD13988.1 SDR family oxidoreductase [Nonomuraea diastatica]